MEMESKENSICCPQFDPLLWDGQTVSWDNKLFINDKVCTLFYMPLNFSGVMKRITKTMENAGAKMPDGLMLSEHVSMWNMKLLVAVDKEITNVELARLSGTFYCKVYEGAFKETGNWMKDFKNQAALKGLSIEKQWMWYTTCPKCAKKYGKNYVAIFGQLAPS